MTMENPTIATTAATSSKARVPFAEAFEIAERIRQQLAPHCERVEIAGSIRRKKSEIGDIEIVLIAKPYTVDLLASGVAMVIDQWPAVRGQLPCKYTQRILPEGIKLDLFFARPENWGFIFAIRTGSAEFSHRVLGMGWRQRGYEGAGGMLTYNGRPIPIPEEEDLFRICGLPFIKPEFRI